jgi:SAM-dependent methyltransferase
VRRTGVNARLDTAAHAAALDTYEFAATHLSPTRPRVLEVGCGRGHFAALLGGAGFSVVAVDASRESVEAARSLGVDARLAVWPDFDGGPFDAVLFTRSLHHIGPLDLAVERTSEVLASEGVLLVEDFAVEGAEAPALEWLYRTTRLLVASGVADVVPQSFAERLLACSGGIEAWREHHHHDIHTAVRQREEIAAAFKVLYEERSPYYYRYLLPMLGDSERGFDVARELRAGEEALLAAGAFAPIGVRLVARLTRIEAQDAS